MKKLYLCASVVLLVAAALVTWGSNFATNMVHDQLAAQKITFADKATLEKAGEPASIVKFAGQPVDSGVKAKAYSEYIKGHLEKVANGQTYSEVSSAFQKDKTNKTLEGQRMTLFMGETLRGLLLNAWGWGLIGSIAMYVSWVLFLAAAVALVMFMKLSMASSKKASKRKK